jgi:uncharacterized membrane protein YcaP (DUF421 family)
VGISFIRTIILYVIVVTAVRVMGKRQIGELQPSELVVAILISELAAIPMQETGIPLPSGVIPILTLISCEIILSTITLLSTKARKLITGQPSILIMNGIIDQKEMRRLRFTIDDLMEELRIGGYRSISEVAFAVVETNGKLSIFPTCQNTPVTAGMMNLTCEESGLPLTLVSDGSICHENLKKSGKNKTWLDNQLKDQKLKPEEVFLMTVDSTNATVIIPKQRDRS